MGISIKRMVLITEIDPFYRWMCVYITSAHSNIITGKYKVRPQMLKAKTNK